MGELTWLHLSDWHQRSNSSNFDRQMVYDRMLDDIRRRREIHQSIEQVHFVIFSGDLTYSAEKDEFDLVFNKFLNPILEILKLKPDRLFIVPGNHDLDRKALQFLGPELQKRLKTRERINHWLTNDEKNLNHIREPFNTFRKAVEQYTGQMDPDYACFRRFEVDGQAIDLWGLNSALMSARVADQDNSGEFDDDGHLFIGEPQIIVAADKAADDEAALRIAVVHHPLDWLERDIDKNLTEPLLQRVCSFVLCGHQHSQRTDNRISQMGNCIHVQAGASYERRFPNSEKNYANGYNFVHIDFKTEKGAVYLRHFDGHNWKALDIGQENKPGIFPFFFSSQNKTSLLPRTTGHINLSSSSRHAFVGREFELKEVISAINCGQSTLIWGFAGVGKTELANQAIANLEKGFRVIRVPARFPRLDTVLNSISNAYDRKDLLTESTPVKLDECILIVQRERVVVHIDNVENMEDMSDFEALAEHCTLLLTSRKNYNFTWLKSLRINELSENESLQLFQDASPRDVSGEMQKLQKLCTLLGCMPLAIILLARRTDDYSLDRMIGSLKHRLLSDDLRQVERAFAITYEQLDDDAKTFFSMLSLFNGYSFSHKTVQSMWAENNSWDILGRLIDLALITQLDLTRGVLHPLIHEFACIKFEGNNQKLSFEKKMIEHFIRFAISNRKDFDTLATEHDAIMVALNHCRASAELSTRYVELAEAVLKSKEGHFAYGYLPMRGYWNEAIEIARKCLDIITDDRKKAMFHGHLGLFHYWLGVHDKAKANYEVALKLYQKVDDFHGQAVVCQHLGFIESDEGNYAACEKLYRESTALAVKHNLSEDFLATCIHLVGTILYHRCHYKDSCKELEAALEMRRRSTNEKDLKNATAASVTQRRLAATLRRMGNLDRSDTLLQTCLEIDRATKNQRNIARCLRQLGMVKIDKGIRSDSKPEDTRIYLDEAKSFFDEALEIFKKIRNPKGEAATLTNLGELEIQYGRLDTAKQYLNQSIELAGPGKLNSRYGMGMNARWLAEIAYRENDFETSVAKAKESLCHFEELKFYHVEEAATVLNQSLVKIHIESRARIAPSEYYRKNNDPINRTDKDFDDLWLKAQPRLESGNPKIDPHLGEAVIDNRRGISLVLRLSTEVRELLSQVSDRLKAAAPEQYHYEPEEYHVTVTTLVEAHDGFNIEKVPIDYLETEFEKMLFSERPFCIAFCGISATPDCVVVRCYFLPDTLNAIRRKVNDIIVSAPQSPRLISCKRNSVHVTLMRFRTLANTAGIIDEVRKSYDLELGILPVKTIQLVENDWYLSKDKVILFKEFPIGGFKR